MTPADAAPLTTILDEFRQGKESAFNTLYSIYFKPIYRKIYVMVKEEAVTDELVQDLFLKIWQKREDINATGSFESYLYKIAQNLVYDYFRKIAKDQRLTNYLLLNATDYYLHSDQLLEDKESRKILMQAIDQLSPQRKQVFISCKLEGKSYEETGKEMGISVATVNSHMTQSFKQVKGYMASQYDLPLLAVLMASLLASSIAQEPKLLNYLLESTTKMK